MQTALEADYEELEKTIKEAYRQLAEFDNEEQHIEAYFDTIKCSSSDLI